jgi:hypothetical protein
MGESLSDGRNHIALGPVPHHEDVDRTHTRAQRVGGVVFVRGGGILAAALGDEQGENTMREDVRGARNTVELRSLLFVPLFVDD